MEGAEGEKEGRVLPTKWRRKPAGIELTSLSPYVLVFVSSFTPFYFFLFFWLGANRCGQF